MFPWTTAPQASPSITNSWSLLKLMSIESVKPFNHLVLCHPLLFLLSIFPSIRVFSKVSVLHIRWPKYWSFSFSISPSKEYSGLIFFRIDWFDLLAVQGTLESLLQHDNSMVVKWLRLCTPKAGSLGSIPGLGLIPGTRSHMLQLRFHMLQLKIPCAPTKTWNSQINK